MKLASPLGSGSNRNELSKATAIAKMQNKIAADKILYARLVVMWS
jgi:hypothetical protein